MRYILTFFILFFLSYCNQSDEKMEDKSIIAPVPEIKFTPLQKSVDSALTEIMTKEIASGGNKISSINISGMEIIKISKKEYYTYEMEQQETDFNNYLQYLKRFSNTKSPINDPLKLQESKAKHNAVMAYLKKEIKTASTNSEIYKVAYYLKAVAGSFNYNDLKTTFLDKEYKKIVLDYSFLKVNF
jgi:hypothetical protein